METGMPTGLALIPRPGKSKFHLSILTPASSCLESPAPKCQSKLGAMCPKNGITHSQGWEETAGRWSPCRVCAEPSHDQSYSSLT